MKILTNLALSFILATGIFFTHRGACAQEQGLPVKTGSVTSSTAPAKTILILDASGSMWGKIDGKTKIEIAKETLTSLLLKWNTSANPGHVGLMAYGHRSKGDCGDIELIAPVAPLSLEAMQGTIKKISPKGKTPMTEAVKRAAESLRSSEEAATVILISDGEETCEADPCKVVEELEKSGVQFTAHVVGFDLDNAGDTARAQMKCIAEKSGGKFVEASSATQLLAALSTVAQVQEVAAAPTIAPTAEPTPVPTEVPASEPTETPDPVNNVRAQAILLEGGEPLTEGVAWKIFKKKEDGEPGKEVAFSYDAELKKAVPVGEYLLSVSSGAVELTQPLTVAEAPVRLLVNLNAGYLSAKAKSSDQGEELSSGLSWKVFEQGSKKETTHSYDSLPKWLVPAGEYKLTVRWGDATGEQKVAVAPGEESNVEIALNAGIVVLSAFATEGGEKLESGLSYKVYEIESSLSKKRKEVTHSYDASPEFSLPAGKYIVELKWGHAKAPPLEVQVVPNERTEASLTIGAGVLSLTLNPTATSSTRAWEVFSMKKRLDGSNESVAHSYTGEVQFFLNAGSYKVVLTLDDNPTEKEVTITAGERVELTLP